MVQGDALKIIKYLYQKIQENKINSGDIEVSDKSWKLKFTGVHYQSRGNSQDEEEEDDSEKIEQRVFMKVEVHEIVKDSKYMISGSRLNGSTMAFYRIWERLEDIYGGTKVKTTKGSYDWCCCASRTN